MVEVEASYRHVTMLLENTEFVLQCLFQKLGGGVLALQLERESTCVVREDCIDVRAEK